MHDDLIKLPLAQQYRGSFQELADARRVLKVTNKLRKVPVLEVSERLELERIRALAIRCIEAAAGDLVDMLDALHDADAELNGDELDGSSAEEDIPSSAHNGPLDGPGCSLGDPGEEDDHSGDPLDQGELGDCHGQCC